MLSLAKYASNRLESIALIFLFFPATANTLPLHQDKKNNLNWYLANSELRIRGQILDKVQLLTGWGMTPLRVFTL